MPCDPGDDCRPTFGGVLLLIALTLGTWVGLFLLLRSCGAF